MTHVEDRRDAPSGDEVRVVELVERPAIVVRVSGTTAEMPRLFGEAFGRTADAIGRAGAAFAGPPFARYLSFGERIEAEMGFPFQGSVEPGEGMTLITLPAGRAVTTRHVGQYDEIGRAWERSSAWMRGFGVEPTGAPWECYLTGPDEPGPPVTEIFWPID